MHQFMKRDQVAGGGGVGGRGRKEWTFSLLLLMVFLHR